MRTWFFVGIIKLLILTYQDYKNKMRVDDRYNYLMIGLTIALISYYRPPLWYLLLATGINLTLMYYLKKFKVFGAADINTILWSFTGFAVFGVAPFVSYMVLIIVFYFIQFLVNKLITKKKKFPAYLIFLFAFISNMLIFKLWGIEKVYICTKYAGVC